MIACSRQVFDHFASSSVDLTPPTAPAATRVLYAPVAFNARLLSQCASILSESERQRAGRFATDELRAGYLQRRAFRRFCGALALKSGVSLSRVEFSENGQGRPALPSLPHCWFSFSACRQGMAAAWSHTHAIGVDSEDTTRRIDVADMARLYFSAREARLVGKHSGETQCSRFFSLWMLKESALKSIGEGLPFGLSEFEFDLEPEPRIVHVPAGYGEARQFRAHLPGRSDTPVAVVIRDRV